MNVWHYTWALWERDFRSVNLILDRKQRPHIRDLFDDRQINTIRFFHLTWRFIFCLCSISPLDAVENEGFKSNPCLGRSQGTRDTLGGHSLIRWIMDSSLHLGISYFNPAIKNVRHMFMSSPIPLPNQKKDYIREQGYGTIEHG